MSVQGTLEDLGIVELLQMPARERKSGVLIIHTGDHHAELAYHQGTLTFARRGESVGEEAVYQLLTCTQGTFQFQLGAVSKLKNIQLKLENIILEGLRRMDENRARKQAVRFPPGQKLQLEARLQESLQEDGGFRFAAILDLEDGHVLIRQDREPTTPAAPLPVVPLVALFKGPAHPGEEDPCELVACQTRDRIILCHRLAGDLLLLAGGERGTALGTLFLALRRGAEGINVILLK